MRFLLIVVVVFVYSKIFITKNREVRLRIKKCGRTLQNFPIEHVKIEL